MEFFPPGVRHVPGVTSVLFEAITKMIVIHVGPFLAKFEITFAFSQYAKPKLELSRNKGRKDKNLLLPKPCLCAVDGSDSVLIPLKNIKKIQRKTVFRRFPSLTFPPFSCAPLFAWVFLLFTSRIIVRPAYCCISNKRMCRTRTNFLILLPPRHSHPFPYLSVYFSKRKKNLIWFIVEIVTRKWAKCGSFRMSERVCVDEESGGGRGTGKERKWGERYDYIHIRMQKFEYK